MNTIKLLNLGSKQLKHNQISSYRLDSEILLSKVLGKTREDILTNQNEQISFDKVNQFSKFIKRRSLKEPVAYIIKEKEFWSNKFKVTKNTLIPRPETEIMIEKLVKIYKGKYINFLDIGTGSGCILISLLKELNKSKAVGIDISKKALKVANFNSEKLNTSKNAKFLKRSYKQIYYKKFDLIVSNPPYILSKEIKNLDEDIKKYEPRIAIDGGNDGLDVIKKVIYKSKEILKINGRLAIEIGSGQSRKVSKILKKNYFRLEFKIKDYNGNIRCLISTFKGK